MSLASSRPPDKTIDKHKTICKTQPTYFAEYRKTLTIFTQRVRTATEDEAMLLSTQFVTGATRAAVDRAREQLQTQIGQLNLADTPSNSTNPRRERQPTGIRFELEPRPLLIQPLGDLVRCAHLGT